MAVATGLPAYSKVARVRASLVLVLGVMAATPAFAHHTVANTVDISAVVPLTGTVTAVQWKNPHAIYHLAVGDAAGATVDWEIESRHLQGMRQDGIEQETIKIGDRVTMNVMLARDGSHHAATASIVLSDGRTVRVCTVTDNACP
jgi:hypothetical protein